MENGGKNGEHDINTSQRLTEKEKKEVLRGHATRLDAGQLRN